MKDEFDVAYKNARAKLTKLEEAYWASIRDCARFESELGKVQASVEAVKRRHLDMKQACDEARKEAQDAWVLAQGAK